MHSKPHDIIIIGAGPGGSAAAFFLARTGMNVLLLDKAQFPRDKTCGDGLSPRAIAVLHQMGILQRVRQIAHQVKYIDFYAPNGGKMTAPIPQANGLSDYVLVSPRLKLDNAIYQRALEGGAVSQSGVRVNAIKPTSTGVEVKGSLKGKSVSYRGRIAVIATGANPTLLLRSGILKTRPQTMLASRAYYEGISDLPQGIIFRYDGVPLPGYGWVFPTSETTANLGAGFYRVGLGARKMPKTSQIVLQKFLQHPPMKELLSGARQVGPVKGYPLRVDFPTAPTYGPHTLVVGEAAGLVNPLTGEGIDYALESGKIAAIHLIEVFKKGDFSPQSLKPYDALLRQRFQRQFVYSSKMRDLFFGNRLILNRLISSGAKDEYLKNLVVNIAFGNEDAAKGISFKTILKVFFPSLV